MEHSENNRQVVNNANVDAENQLDNFGNNAPAGSNPNQDQNPQNEAGNTGLGNNNNGSLSNLEFQDSSQSIIEEEGHAGIPSNNTSIHESCAENQPTLSNNFIFSWFERIKLSPK